MACSNAARAEEKFARGKGAARCSRANHVGMVKVEVLRVRIIRLASTVGYLIGQSNRCATAEWQMPRLGAVVVVFDRRSHGVFTRKNCIMLTNFVYWTPLPSFAHAEMLHVAVE